MTHKTAQDLARIGSHRAYVAKTQGDQEIRSMQNAGAPATVAVNSYNNTTVEISIPTKVTKYFSKNPLFLSVLLYVGA